MDIPITAIKPFYHPSSTSTSTTTTTKEPPSIEKTIQTLHLTPHIEGGYFAETDRNAFRIPNPFLSHYHQPKTATTTAGDSTRSASSSIFYFLTPQNPLGAFHRNRARTVHTLHRGRGRYVIIHADEVLDGTGTTASSNSTAIRSTDTSTAKDKNEDADENENNSKKAGKARIETFVVGHDIVNGERLQWVVEGGKFKASFLLPDMTPTTTTTPTTTSNSSQDKSEGNNLESQGLLISETVVPGFEYSDHDFLRAKTMEELLTPKQVEELKWLVRKGG